jgi:hypothetical protein
LWLVWFKRNQNQIKEVLFEFIYKVTFCDFPLIKQKTLSIKQNIFLKMPCSRHFHSRSHRTCLRSHRVQLAWWHDPMVNIMLIDERERRNTEYHSLYSRSRQEFWESVAWRYILFYMFFKKNLNSTIHLYEFRINRHYRTRFTGQQCSQKWRNLVKDYNVSKKNKLNFIYIRVILQRFWYLEFLPLS